MTARAIQRNPIREWVGTLSFFPSWQLKTRQGCEMICFEAFWPFLQFLLFPCLLMGLLLYSVDPNYCTCGYESAMENQNKISLFRLPTVVQNIKKNQKQARKWWFHTAFNPNRGSGSLNLKPALSTGQQRLHTHKKSCLKKKWKGWGAKKKSNEKR